MVGECLFDLCLGWLVVCLCCLFLFDVDFRLVLGWFVCFYLGLCVLS